jgi:hypothetical protein
MFIFLKVYQLRIQNTTCCVSPVFKTWRLNSVSNKKQSLSDILTNEKVMCSCYSCLMVFCLFTSLLVSPRFGRWRTLVVVEMIIIKKSSKLRNGVVDVLKINARMTGYCDCGLSWFYSVFQRVFFLPRFLGFIVHK